MFSKKKKKKDPRAGGYNQNRHQRDFSNQSPRNNVLMVNSVFKDPIYQILEKIKMNHTLSGPTRWGEIYPSKIKASIVITIKKGDIQPRIAGLYAITWANW